MLRGCRATAQTWRAVRKVHVPNTGALSTSYSYCTHIVAVKRVDAMSTGSMFKSKSRQPVSFSED